MSYDKLEPLQIYFHKTYYQQTWESDDLGWWDLTY